GGSLRPPRAGATRLHARSGGGPCGRSPCSACRWGPGARHLRGHAGSLLRGTWAVPAPGSFAVLLPSTYITQPSGRSKRSGRLNLRKESSTIDLLPSALRAMYVAAFERRAAMTNTEQAV